MEPSTYITIPADGQSLRANVDDKYAELVVEVGCRRVVLIFEDGRVQADAWLIEASNTLHREDTRRQVSEREQRAAVAAYAGGAS